MNSKHSVAATAASPEDVAAWMLEAADLDRVADSSLNEARLRKVRAGLALLAHDGDGDYSRATGLTDRQRKEARNFARAWGRWAPDTLTWPTDATALPPDWVDVSNRIVESRGLRGRSTSAHNRGKVFVNGKWSAKKRSTKLVEQTTSSAPERERDAAPGRGGPRGVVDLRYGVDVLDGLRSLPDACIDTIVTSPPYHDIREAEVGHEGEWGREATGAQHLAQLMLAIGEMGRVLRPEGVLWVNYAERRHGGQFEGLPERLLARCHDAGWSLLARVVLVKSNPWHRPQNAAQGLIRTEWEPLYALTRDRSRRLDVNEVLVDLPPKTLENIRRAQERGVDEVEIRRLLGDPNGKKTLGDVWTIPQLRLGDHPCPFHEEVPRRCILLSCPDDGIVLDPFCGSATTGVAALSTGRRFVGIDLHERFLMSARQRLRAAAAAAGLVVEADALDRMAS